MVSNHGARQLDGVEATIDALEEIVNMVNQENSQVELYLGTTYILRHDISLQWFPKFLALCL